MLRENILFPSFSMHIPLSFAGEAFFFLNYLNIIFYYLNIIYSRSCSGEKEWDVAAEAAGVALFPVFVLPPEGHGDCHQALTPSFLPILCL